ncbi:hypothetical protein GCM10017608_19010 [Agromyces luteolus]|uniref:Uncharacterized protein n=1 Tax=Agromyces luteolus TaxID=88373 RepID=A0A7C9LXA7_9MICO|nr:O-methyltransferase [Agromyces luteolus]MUN08019.1 hypothetical protein [Agromyces luteolus]GLK27967.1 hypothetical protein GCM10017608_19010 [Agromyces luteolus]
MAKSSFDYRHRPAKNIERHLIVEMARRFMDAHRGVEFQYIGMGALEFLDFELMHRVLNIKRMYSIESREPARFEFNKPFKTIQVVHGFTTDVFRRGDLDFTKPTIMWLDYTASLNASVLADLITVARGLASPSMFLVTLNAQPVSPLTNRLQEFESRIGAQFVPPGVSDSSLGRHGLAEAQRTVVDSVLKSAVRERKDSTRWAQSLNFHYRDNALMQTVGGFLLPTDITDREIREWLRGMDYYMPAETYLDLRVPVVTARERAILDRQLPKVAKSPLNMSFIPAEDLAAYRRVYRYLHLAGLQSAAETTWTA